MFAVGELVEVRMWLERAIDAADDEDSPDLASCLTHLARIAVEQGDAAAAHSAATQSVAMWRRMDATGHSMAAALRELAVAEEIRGDIHAARAAIAEELALAQRSNDQSLLADALADMGVTELRAHNFERGLTLAEEAVAVYERLGDRYGVVTNSQNGGYALLGLGRSSRG